MKDKLMWAIFCWGCALRSLRVFTGPALDDDEGVIYTCVTRNSFINHVLRSEPGYGEHIMPPFSALVSKLWLAIANTELVFRLHHWLFSILALWLFLDCCPRIFARLPGLKYGAALFFASSSFFVYFGIAFRPYSLTVLLCMAALWCFLRVGEEKRSSWGARTFSLAVATALALWTDYSAVWFVGGALLCLVASRKWGKAGWAMLVGCMANVPWLVFSLLPHFGSVLAEKQEALAGIGWARGDVASAPFSSWMDFVTVFSLFSDAKFALPGHPSIAWALLGVGVLAVMGMWRIRRVDRRLGDGLLLASLVPLVVTVGFSLVSSPVFDHKNLWPANLVLIVGAMGCLLVGWRSWKPGFAALSLYFLLTAPFTLRSYVNQPLVYDSSVAREALERVAHETGGQAVVVIPDVNMWEHTLVAYKDWYAPGSGLVFARSKTPGKFYALEPVTGFEETVPQETSGWGGAGVPIYFYSLSVRDQREQNLHPLAELLGCRLTPVPLTGEQAELSKCI